MRLAVTGAGGFLGWHVRCYAFSQGIETVAVPRGGDVPSDVTAVIHCAGVNRGSDADVTEGNLAAAQSLAKTQARVVYANSVQAHGDTVYGKAKRQAGEQFSGQFSNVLLPNLFGEHGRPHYNSFVATFCHEVAAGRRPVVKDDREIPLLHAQAAAEILVTEASATGERVVEAKAETMLISDVLRLLDEFAAVYSTAELPDISDPWRQCLFSTFRSYLFPRHYPIALPVHSDARGSLVECVRTGASGGQAFVSTSVPGATRGEHVHLRKFERFLVLDGEATISLRRLFHDEVIRYHVSGNAPSVVDIPAMWVHNLTNTGDRPVTAFFWSSEPYNAADPDTFPCLVDGSLGTP